MAEKATTLGVLYIDADHFKDVNDTFGHKTGDEVLRMVGQSLANGLRRGDVPVRWGGEEFLALLPGTDEVGLHATAERVRMLSENSWIQKGDVQVRVTVSVGATMAVPTETAEELVDRADRFMYASEQAGRNRVTTDTGGLTSGAQRPILGTAAPLGYGVTLGAAAHPGQRVSAKDRYLTQVSQSGPGQAAATSREASGCSRPRVGCSPRTAVDLAGVQV